MAYGLKYYSEIGDYYGRTVRVEIAEKDYSGTTSEMILTADPIKLAYPGDDNDILKSIFGSELTLNIVSMTDFQYLEFHTSDARRYSIAVKVDGVIDWQGWLLPDLFNEPYIAPPYVVSIKARCGIGELKEINCPQILDTTPDYTINFKDVDFIEPFMLIYRGLEQCSQITEIHENINLYPFTGETDADSPLMNTKIYLSEYANKNWYEAIEDILKAFNARLFLSGGVWRIRRIWERETTMRKWVFTQNNGRTVLDSLTYDTFSPATKLIGKPQNRNLLTGGATLDIEPALKEFTIQNKFGIHTNLFANSDFSDVTQIEDINDQLVPSTINSINDWIVPPEKDGSRLKNYLIPSLGYIKYSDLVYRRYYYEEPYMLIPTQGLNEYNTRIQQTLQTFDFPIFTESEKTKMQGFVFSAGIGVWGNSNINKKAAITSEIKATSGSTVQYLKRESDGTYSWTTTESRIPFTVEVFENINEPLFAKVEILTGLPLLSDTTICITLINLAAEEPATTAPASGFAIQYPVFRLFESYYGVDFSLYPSDVNNNFNINSNNVRVPSPLELITGDLPDIPNNINIWKGGLRFSNNSPTSLWHNKGETTEISLVAMHALFYGALKFIPQFKLKLQIMAEDVNFDNNIVDYQVLPKEYICNSLEYKYRDCILDGTFLEIGNWTGGEWILETGVWNKDGVWTPTGIWKSI